MIKVLAINISGIEMAALHRIIGHLNSTYKLIPAVTDEELTPIVGILTPDLIVIDFHKGYNLGAEVRLSESTKNTPVFVVGNPDEPTMKEEYNKIGITTFLDVPLQEKVVCNYIKKYFNLDKPDGGFTVDSIKKKVA